MGDEVRFGNVSFLFVPAAQVVDVSKYAGRANKNRTAIIGAFSLIIIVMVVVAIVFVIRSKSNSNKEQITQASVKEEKAQFEKKLSYAKDAYENENLNEAQDVIQDLLRKHPDDPELIELNKKVNFDNDNKKTFEKAKALSINSSDDSNFDEAIEKFQQVDPKSKYYDKAQEQIKIINLKVVLKQYNEAYKKCEDVTAACITDLCDAIKILNETIKESEVDDTIYKTANNKHDSAIKHMEGLASSKKKYAATAKKCLKEIK
jgi:tetratricopeptide (TPR) repeat protein